ncbi:MAG TPA: M56 family metallopeptidase [Pyrinomonadaceae bacterium]|nr:M56 family metallopeptidase [Pyrinomonadaceae bacterium]
MYELLGVCLALAALLATNTLGAAAAALAWRALSRRASRWDARTRADALFTLRVLPTAFAVFAVFALVVPAYVAHEPRQTEEVVGVKLLALALVSAAGVGVALRRLLGTWTATRRLARGWLRGAEPVRLRGVSVPAYKLPHEFPLVAVLGVFRPRLFVATSVLESLTPEELAAVVSHERGHLRARDNLKRALIRACQDALPLVPLGRPLTRGWQLASEEAADEYAARRGTSQTLCLASALVKIARHVPASAKLYAPSGVFFAGEGEGDVERRVRRLLALAERDGERPAPARPRLLGRAALASCSGLCAALAFTLFFADTLRAVHLLIEHAVEALR